MLKIPHAYVYFSEILCQIDIRKTKASLKRGSKSKLYFKIIFNINNTNQEF